ncbi:hypothetical protein RHMOL_Rhmol05G0207900 [Rhododendron molle]|uniref:Uncharacterized protein n=1 Tax=Rhododendron molle TaxID=49168 RepID=A0ACC0NSU5_RHOML|nr:hypothetical protein RHMOL_Rhmol05G0207900 [Rhododendron molle]
MWNESFLRGEKNCKALNKVTEILPNATTGIRIHALLSPNTRYNTAPKATIVDKMETNRVMRPVINLLGKVYRKSSSA